MSCKVIYSNGKYMVFHNQFLKNDRKYKIVYKDNKSIHTHRYNEKESIDLANFAKHETIPNKANIDYLISLRRLAIDRDFRMRLNNLIKKKRAIKRGNKRQNKRKYHNNPIGYKY